MKHATILSYCIAFTPLLLGSSCPTEEPPLPPPPDAPAFTGHSIVVEKVNDAYAELVYLQWQPPANASVEISEYQIIQHLPFDTSIDTLGLFPTNTQLLPAERNYAYQLTEDVRQYAHGGEVINLFYQILAIDIYGRQSDTSANYSVQLFKNASMIYPRDSLGENRFEWEIRNVTDEIYTNMRVWNEHDTTPIFISDTTIFFAPAYDVTNIATALSSYPLQPGMYTWAVWAQKLLITGQDNSFAESFTIGTFHAL